MPALFAALLLIWEVLTIKNFHFFGGIVVFFISGILLNILLKKKLGYSFHLFIYFYLFFVLVICFLITPSPYKTWMDYQSIVKNDQPLSLMELNKFSQIDLVNLKDARTLYEAMGIDSYGSSDGGGSNGARGIVPVVDKNYNPGDSIYAYAAFTTYIRDQDNAGWFALDKDEYDYAEAWKTPVTTAKIVKDTSRINLYNTLMKRANAQFKLTPSTHAIFIQSNYPSADFIYVAHELTVVGVILLILAAGINIYTAVSVNKKEDTE
jgi:hypothetical protein